MKKSLEKNSTGNAGTKTSVHVSICGLVMYFHKAKLTLKYSVTGRNHFGSLSLKDIITSFSYILSLFFYPQYLFWNHFFFFSFSSPGKLLQE